MDKVSTSVQKLADKIDKTLAAGTGAAFDSFLSTIENLSDELKEKLEKEEKIKKTEREEKKKSNAVRDDKRLQLFKIGQAEDKAIP